MRILNQKEFDKANGAYAFSAMLGGFPFYSVSENSYYSIENSIVGQEKYLLQDTVFFSNRVENLSGQEVFNGHSGSFCYKGNNFLVLSIDENSTPVGNLYSLTSVC